jgi:hypothetical protein
MRGVPRPSQSHRSSMRIAMPARVCSWRFHVAGPEQCQVIEEDLIGGSELDGANGSDM